jgi:hypothetical protein
MQAVESFARPVLDSVRSVGFGIEHAQGALVSAAASVDSQALEAVNAGVIHAVAARQSAIQDLNLVLQAQMSAAVAQGRAVVGDAVGTVTGAVKDALPTLPGFNLPGLAAAAADGFASALEGAVPSLPVVGAALTALASVVRLAQRMQHNNVESQLLLDRVVRLQGLIERAAQDEVFVLAHTPIFEGMVVSLQSAEKTLVEMAERWTVMKLVNARWDIAQLANVDRTMSRHLAELGAAMQAETLSSVRALHVAVSKRALESPASPGQGNTTIIINSPTSPVPLPVYELPPPFSMQFSLKDILFDPPMED